MAIYQPRWYIEEAIDATFDYWETHGGTAEDGAPIQADPLVALPTGTGKSHYGSQLMGRAIERFPNTTFIAGTHVKELVEQNAAAFQENFPHISVGIHSAGLNKRDRDQQVIFGNIQSMRKHPEIFKYRDISWIDEAHLMAPNVDASYGQFIGGLRLINPWHKVCGTSATPYRMGLGLMTEGPMFTDIAYNATTMEAFARLLAEGYLCPPVSKKTTAQIDPSKLRIGSNGDYSEASAAAAVDEITFDALREVVQYGWDRRAWLLFAPKIESAERIAGILRDHFGVPCQAVHSKTDQYYGQGARDKFVQMFKSGELRCLVNVDTLTTGFDHPPIDLIGMLRPTMSTGLWVQMLGRGTRPFPGKLNCLVLDFAGNTRRLGPINDPVIPRPRGSGKPGDSPVKICGQPGCGVYNHSSARNCVACNYEFPREEKGPGIEATASTDELLRSDMPEVVGFDVFRVVYEVHNSVRNGGQSLKVAYYCSGLRTFYEYLKFEDAKPFAIHKAHEWLRQRTPDAEWAINELKSGQHAGVAHYFIEQGTPAFRIPSRINVWVNTSSPRIMSYEF